MGNQNPTQPGQKENQTPDQTRREDGNTRRPDEQDQQDEEPGELHKPGQGTR